MVLSSGICCMAPFDSILLLYHYKNEGKFAPVVSKACNTLKWFIIWYCVDVHIRCVVNCNL
jgi:hypothetical protein